MTVEYEQLTNTLAALMAGAKDQQESFLPQRLCSGFLEVLPVDGAGLSLMSAARPAAHVLLGSSDEVSARLEQLQFDLGEGPCMVAFGDSQPTLVPDLTGADPRHRWPLFTQEALDLGVAAVFALPLQVGGNTIGVLDCHRKRPGPLRELRKALLVIEAVTRALLDPDLRGSAATKAADIPSLASEDQAVVHQASGMVAARLGIGIDEALAIIRGHAFARMRSVGEVASEVVLRKLELDLPEES